MPIVRDFVFEEDDETGVQGLKPTWIENANAGLGIAHDVLEHFKYDPSVNAIEAELLALGALVALRIEAGTFNHYYPPKQQLANVLMGVFREIVDERRDLPRARNTPKLPSDWEWTDNLICAAVPLGFELLRKELENEDFLDNEPVLQPEVTSAIIAWLRTGYRKAQQRFKKEDLYTIGECLFKKVDEATKKLLNSELLDIGDRVRVCITPRNFTVRFKINGKYSVEYA